jgi:hypothetical protein
MAGASRAWHRKRHVATPKSCALEAKHCDPEVREPFIAALASVERPQR